MTKDEALAMLDNLEYYARKSYDEKELKLVEAGAIVEDEHE